jgi:HK97 family phage major capsid protein
MLRNLLERRAQIITEMRGLTAKPSGDGGDLSSEQTANFDKLKSELESLEKRIERQKLVDEAERRMNGEPLTNRSDGHFDDLCREASLTRAIASQIDPRSVDCGREFEISKELARRSGRTPQGIFVPLNALVEKRVQTTGGDIANVVRTDVLADQFIDALRPATVLGALGARLLTGLRDDIAIPKMDALTPAAEWLETEGTSALSGGDHSFTQVTGTPHHVGLMTEWSRKTMLQANPSIESLVRADFTAKLAAAIDLAGLAGTGATGQPEGILTNSNILEETLTDNAVAWSNVLGMIAQVLASDVRGGRFGWTFNAYVQAYLRSKPREQGLDATNGYLMDTPNSCAGYPAEITSQMAGNPNSSPAVAGAMLFGDFSQVILAFWGDSGADILVNPYADSVYAKGNVLIRAFLDADVLIRHPEGFCFCDGITLTSGS